jgi:hypothetical protein
MAASVAIAAGRHRWWYYNSLGKETGMDAMVETAALLSVKLAAFVFSLWLIYQGQKYR